MFFCQPAGSTPRGAKTASAIFRVSISRLKSAITPGVAPPSHSHFVGALVQLSASSAVSNTFSGFFTLGSWTTQSRRVTCGWLSKLKARTRRPSVSDRLSNSSLTASLSAGHPPNTFSRNAFKYSVCRCLASAGLASGRGGAAFGTKLSSILVFTSSSGSLANTRSCSGAKTFVAAISMSGFCPFKNRLNHRNTGNWRSCVSACGPSVMSRPSWLVLP